MSRRRSRTRRAARRERRRAAQRATRSRCRETRDPRTRWRALRARGGQEISFLPTGIVVEIEELDETAPAQLVAALHPDEAEA